MSASQRLNQASYLAALSLLAAAAESPDAWIPGTFHKHKTATIPFPSQGSVPGPDQSHSNPSKVASGRLASGEYLEIQEFTLGHGESPHPPHQHSFVEFLLVRTGIVESVCAETTRNLTPGIIGFIPVDEMHCFRNIGPGRAQCVLIALGKQAPAA